MAAAPRPLLERLPLFLLAALALSAVAFRLALAPATPVSFDEVSFLIALERYDLLAFEPHFPGYPLTVLLARGVQGLGATRPYAALNALALVPALLALYRLAGGGWRGLWAASLFAWAPLAVHEALRPLSDTLAASLALVALALLIPPRGAPPRLGRLLLGALVLGASAAAKPDHALLLAFLILPLWRSSSRALAAAGALVIVSGWAAFGLSALAAGCGGLQPALEEGLRFLGGHLTEWGGLEASSPRVVYAAASLADFAPREAGWSALGIQLASALALGALALRAPRWLRRRVILGALPYAAWFLFGQNLAHPRHALVLAPLLLVLAARGLPRSRFGVALATLLLGAALNATALRSPAWREGARPLDRVVAELERGPATTRLYASASARALQHRLPTHDIRRVRDPAGLRADLAASPLTPLRVLVLPEVLEAAAGPWPPRSWEEISAPR